MNRTAVPSAFNAALVWLASFRLRVLFRTAFLLLAVATLVMTVYVLQEEKQRSYDNYQASFGRLSQFLHVGDQPRNLALLYGAHDRTRHCGGVDFDGLV